MYDRHVKACVIFEDPLKLDHSGNILIQVCPAFPEVIRGKSLQFSVWTAFNTILRTVCIGFSIEGQQGLPAETEICDNCGKFRSELFPANLFYDLLDHLFHFLRFILTGICD